MNEYMFRVMFVYDKDLLVSCLVFYGDGTYVDRRTKLRVGVTREFEDWVYYNEPKHLTLFYTLCKISDSLEYITERDLIKEINSSTDFRATGSVPYQYKYDKLGKQVFKNVLKKNDLVELIIEED